MSDGLPPVLTPFLRIGGQVAVDRLVDAFYRRMDTLPETRAIRALHPADLTGTKEILQRYLGEWLGGPPRYSEERGHPRLRRRHLHLAIGPAERDAWMFCMSGALAEAVADTVLRDELHSSFLKLADWVRNDPENAHDNR